VLDESSQQPLMAEELLGELAHRAGEKVGGKKNLLV